MEMTEIQEELKATETVQLGTWRLETDESRLVLSQQATSLLGASSRFPSTSQFLALMSSQAREAFESWVNKKPPVESNFNQDFRAINSGLWLRMLGGIDADQTRRGIFIKAGSQHSSNERLASIFASSDDAIVGKTVDGIVTDWNRGAEAIFGYSSAEMLGQSIGILMPAGRENEEQLILARICNGERIDHFETRRRRKDGEIIDVSVTVSPIWDGSGTLVGASKVARDITQAKRAESALQRSEAHLKSVLDSVPDAMVVIDPQGIMQSFSRTAERMFGFSATEAIGQNVSILMPEPDRSKHDSYLGRYMTTGEKRIIGLGRLVVGRRKDGTTFPMALSVGEAQLGEQRLFTGFVQDLTEKQQTEQSLQELRSELIHVSRFTALGEMASTLAHELNQPLTAAASYLNGARRLLDAGQPKDILIAREAIDDSASQVLRAGQIIKRLREFVTRGESHHQVEDLRKLIGEASALALIGIKEAGVQVNFTFAPSAQFVVVDKIQIQQVLLNLFRNAVEAMQKSERRELKLETSSTLSGMAEITVADTGPGIAPDIAEKLFQPFVTSKPQGMGLGLSISRTIVESHGGQLNTEANPGGGTIFRLSLKIAMEPGGPDDAE